MLSTLKEGARISFCGPRLAWISPNLISATQHPDVVSANLQKGVNLGRVAGPYPAPPLANFQCHPVGVIPKKHSNDHIAKDPYSVSYVWVYVAIHILQSLGKGACMAKTDLKSG